MPIIHPSAIDQRSKAPNSPSFEDGYERHIPRAVPPAARATHGARLPARLYRDPRLRLSSDEFLVEFML